MHSVNRFASLVWLISIAAFAQIEPNSPYLFKSTGPATTWPHSTPPQVTINGASPRKVGSISSNQILPGYQSGLVVNDKKVYLMNNRPAPDFSGGSLVIFDVSNPASISLLSTISSNTGESSAIYLSGKYVFFPSLNGINRFDVSNPSSTILLHTDNQNFARPFAVYAQGRYLYVVDQDAALIDSEITSVTGTNSWNVSTLSTGGTFCGTTPEPCADLYVSGNYAYIINVTGGLFVVNISNPKAMTVTGSSATGLTSGRSIYVQGRYAYVADNTNGLVIFDIANPASPKMVSATTTGLVAAQRVVVQGRYAYVADNTNGLVIFDVGGQYNEMIASGEMDAGAVNFGQGNSTDAWFGGGGTVGQNTTIQGDANLGPHPGILFGSIPAISACGTSPANVGNDQKGKITVGSTSPTSCTVTFSQAFSSAPYCVAAASDTTHPVGITSSSLTSLVFNFSGSFSGTIWYRCIQ